MKVKIYNKEEDFTSNDIIWCNSSNVCGCTTKNRAYYQNGYWMPSKLNIPFTTFKKWLKNGNLKFLQEKNTIKYYRFYEAIK